MGGWIDRWMDGWVDGLISDCVCRVGDGFSSRVWFSSLVLILVLIFNVVPVLCGPCRCIVDRLPTTRIPTPRFSVCSIVAHVGQLEQLSRSVTPALLSTTRWTCRHITLVIVVVVASVIFGGYCGPRCHSHRRCCRCFDWSFHGTRNHRLVPHSRNGSRYCSIDMDGVLLCVCVHVHY